MDYNHPGLFTISGSTKSGSTTDTMQVILEEIAKMRTQEVTPEELQAAKDAGKFAIGVCALWINASRDATRIFFDDEHFSPVRLSSIPLTATAELC